MMTEGGKILTISMALFLRFSALRFDVSECTWW